MGDNVINSGVAVATAIIGLAILAVVLGPQSDAKNVITAMGQFFAKIIGKAVAPVS